MKDGANQELNKRDERQEAFNQAVNGIKSAERYYEAECDLRGLIGLKSATSGRDDNELGRCCATANARFKVIPA